ncbi:hypothetical protein BDV96DRAFT_582721 [Lophiotrema nucula]|uniref:DUF4419 domain-containing protein n=1 Tax=Lophiotrema nucula TaxID=690887 RepID=A0A6A5YWM2_9PLEO|nr:hypothetical protein BDV96DRAFT_582721 [Lophiotrema nucula]
MPVTIKPSPETVGRNVDKTVTSSKGIVARYKSKAPKPMLHTSFKDDTTGNDIVPYENGFVRACIRAYQQDLHLVIRPDDVWLSILTQFSFYVNAHAEELRKQFVSHKGKKQLIVELPAISLPNWDIAKMSRKFTALIQENLVDPSVRDWIIPAFTTTTDNDIAVASMTMMATMKEYFSYGACSLCGLPSVTLQGTQEDWENILARLDRFAQYGKEPTAWANLLRPILTRFVATFKDPESSKLKDFWNSICYAEKSYGSGQDDTFSGWITAFAYWSTEGRSLRLTDKWGLMGKTIFQLDGVKYPVIEQSAVPSGMVEVPVMCLDGVTNMEHETTVVAGSVGASVKDGNVLQPVSGWWMFEESKEVWIN